MQAKEKGSKLQKQKEASVSDEGKNLTVGLSQKRNTSFFTVNCRNRLQ